MNPLRDPAIGVELTPREVRALATRTDRAELIERALAVYVIVPAVWWGEYSMLETPERRELAAS